MLSFYKNGDVNHENARFSSSLVGADQKHIRIFSNGIYCRSFDVSCPPPLEPRSSASEAPPTPKKDTVDPSIWR